MRGSRARLVNAVRRSMIQRTELRRKLGIARDELKPGALIGRGKYRVSAKVDDTAHAVRRQFRDNRLPIAIAAAAGLAWLFREPIKEHAPRIGRKFQELADNVASHFHSATDTDPAAEPDQVEEDDEAAQ